MSLLLGVNAFAGLGEGALRQGRALERWRGLGGVHLANLQWADDVFELDGFETHAVLQEDSRTVTGRSGCTCARSTTSRLVAIRPGRLLCRG